MSKFRSCHKAIMYIIIIVVIIIIVIIIIVVITIIIIVVIIIITIMTIINCSCYVLFLQQSECSDRMKDSLAAALRHSREQAQSTYDRRTANQKKALALELARKRAEEPEGDEQPPSDRDDDTTSPHKVGDFVGLVEEGSRLQQPRVLLGRLHAFLPDGQASLLWYKCAGAGLYCLEVDGSQWVESVSSLVPVKVKPAKGKTNCYRLCTSLRTIHKAVHDSRDR